MYIFKDVSKLIEWDKNSKKDNWSNQISNVRAIAIILVVLGHSIIIYSTNWGLYSSINKVPILELLKRIVDIVQMPIFFSISGYLFFYTHRKNNTIVSLIKNKGMRLLIPYIVVGLMYMVPIRYLVRYSGYNGKKILDIILNFLTANDVGHLWFLPALFIIFTICELFLRGIEKIGMHKGSSIMLFFIAGVFYMEGYRIGFGYGPLLSAFANMLWFAIGYMISEYYNFFQEIMKKSL